MTTRDIFGLCLRLVGLWILGLAALRLWLWLSMQGWFGGILALIATVIVGCYLLRGAPALLRYSYPDDRT